MAEKTQAEIEREEIQAAWDNPKTREIAWGRGPEPAADAISPEKREQLMAHHAEREQQKTQQTRRTFGVYPDKDQDRGLELG